MMPRKPFIYRCSTRFAAGKLLQAIFSLHINYAQFFVLICDVSEAMPSNQVFSELKSEFIVEQNTLHFLQLTSPHQSGGICEVTVPAVSRRIWASSKIYCLSLGESSFECAKTLRMEITAFVVDSDKKISFCAFTLKA